MSMTQKNGKVLVTDDDASMDAIMNKCLEDLGCEIVFVQSKVNALERLGEISPDLVTTDLMSPSLGGFDFIRKVKQFDPSIPVIVISGNINANCDASAENVRKALQLGVSACLEKPFDVGILRQMIEIALEIRHRQSSPAMASNNQERKR
jgi:CheY-like chemotaxis protein